MKKLGPIPYPGLRNIKTAIAAVLCIVLYYYIGRSGVVLGLIAAFICMQDSMDKSIKQGIYRIMGTLLGGLFGCVFAYFDIASMHIAIFASSMFLGVVLFIYLCNLLHAQSSIIIRLRFS